MTSWAEARQLALSLPEAEESDHFGSPAFRISSKIFAQLTARDEDRARALVKLPQADQALLLMADGDTFTAAPHWGRHGWTYVRLDSIEATLLRGLLQQSWRLVAPKKLVAAAKF